MYCPRLDHFVRLNQDGTVGKCGHMINAKGFDSYEELEHSDWMATVRHGAGTMANGVFQVPTFRKNKRRKHTYQQYHKTQDATSSEE